MTKRNELVEIEAFFAAIADKTRLRLLNLMRGDEVSVCFLAEILGESQPKISRHLACLRNAGVIEARRDGKRIYYKISERQDVFARRVLDETISWLSLQEIMRIEREKLTALGNTSEVILKIGLENKSNVSVSANTRKNQVRELEVFLL